MNRILQIFLALILAVSMMIEIVPANIVRAEDEVPVEEAETVEAVEEGEETEEPAVAETSEAEEETPPVEEEETAAEEEDEIILNEEAFSEKYTVGDLTVSVSYEAGTVPEGTEVVVSEASEEAINAIKEQYGEDIEFLAADISFMFGDEEIEPKDYSDKKVSVVLSYDGEENSVETIHLKEIIDEDGEVKYDFQTVAAVVTPVTETIQVPVYEKQEITEKRNVPYEYKWTETIKKYKEVDVYGDVEVEYEEEVPVYETREITEERTEYVTKTRQVEKTRTVKVKVDFVWWNPLTWLGYKYVTEKYYVTETYKEPVTVTVVVGTEEVQVGTETVTKTRTERQVIGKETVEDGEEEVVHTETRYREEEVGIGQYELVLTGYNEETVTVSQTVSFEADDFSTFVITWRDSAATNTTTTLRFRNSNSNSNRVTATIHYVDTNGNSITRPSDIGNNTNRSITNNRTTTVSFQGGDALTGTISGYTYQGAYRDSGRTQSVTSLDVLRESSGNNSYTNSYTIYNGTTVVDTGSSGSNNLNAGDIYLVYSGGSGVNTVTVHYVDENGNELTISNPNSTYPDLNEDSYSPSYLIYDIEGYTYSYTYRNTDTEKIRPILSKNNNNHWRYTTSTATDTDNITWTEFENGDNVYVVYSRTPATPSGGTPSTDTGDQTWPEDDGAPQFSKSSKHKGDGQNIITLSITASEKQIEKSTPADVIVVFDVSGSMGEYMGNQTRLQRAKTAVNSMANTLLSANSEVKMALISYSTDATVEQTFTDNYTTFSGKVNGLNAGGGTNWEKALLLANQMAVRNNAATFVVFVTDGDPTFRVSRGDITNNDLDVYNYYAYQYYRNNSVFGTGSSDDQNRNFNFAVKQVSAINGNNKAFYAIGISDDVTKVENLTTQGGVDASHAFIASNSTAMEAAFKAITESIKSKLGFGDVGIHDGITELTNAEMKVMEQVDPKSFKYYRYGGENNKYGADEAHMTEWTTREADGCAAASYDENTGAVEWNMGEGFQLEDHVTYVVTFEVWASQEAFDLITDLNNGIKVYEAGHDNSITDEERSQIIEISAPHDGQKGSYTLKTNTDQVSATYKKTSKTGESVVIEDDRPIFATYHDNGQEALVLDSMQMSVTKVFDDDLTAGEDRARSVTLVLMRRVGTEADKESTVEFEPYNFPHINRIPQFDPDTKEYIGYIEESVNDATIVLSQANNWTISLYVSPGVKASGTVREHGYDFKLTEPNIDYHYDLVEEIINPMIVNDVPTLIGDGDGNSALTGLNRVKSGIDIKKVVKDADGNIINNTDQEFTIHGKLVDAKGNGFTFNTDWDDRPDKSTGNGASAEWQLHQNDTGAYHYYDKTGKRIGYKLHVADTADFTITLKAGERVRFVNVPEGCKFEYYEIELPEGYDSNYVVTGLTQHRASAGSDDFVVDDPELQPTVSEGKVELTTGVVGNKQYTIEFTNKMLKNEYFYVYHSSDNTIERIELSTKDNRLKPIKDKDNVVIIGYEFNLAKETKSGNLYGGYYQSYAGAIVTEDQITGKAESGNVEYVTGTSTTTYDGTRSGGFWATDNDATPYNYSNVESVKWGSDYYTGEGTKGTEMNPVSDTVYYLKEVPDHYDLPYTHYTYNKGDKLLRNMWYISAIDDLKYDEVGFIITTTNEAGEDSTIVQSLTIQNATGGATVTLTPKSVFGGGTDNLYVQSGYLGYWDAKDLIKANTTSIFTPYWMTMDGVTVRGLTTRTINFNNGKTGSGGMRIVNADTAAEKLLADIVTSQSEGE